MHGKMQASGLTKFIPFMCTSAIWGQSCSLFTLLLAFPQLLSSHHGGWQHLQDDSLGSLVVSQGKNLLGAQLLGGFLLWGSPRFLLVFPVPGLTCDNSSQQDSQKLKLKTVWGSIQRHRKCASSHREQFCLPVINTPP